MSEAGVFSGYNLPMGRCGSLCTARLPVIGHSGLPPFVFPGERKEDQGGRSSLVLGMEESQTFCVNQERRRRKECSFHGCIKGDARVPRSFSAKFRIQNLVPPFVVDP